MDWFSFVMFSMSIECLIFDNVFLVQSRRLLTALVIKCWPFLSRLFICSQTNFVSDLPALPKILQYKLVINVELILVLLIEN